MEKDAVNLRKNEQYARLRLRLQQGDRAGAKAIRNIQVAEETKEMLRQLRSLQNRPDSGITTVEVPSNGDLTTAHCKDCTSWSLLTDPVEIRQALICRNRLHFGQAHGTFPTIPPFTNAVDWTASTPDADAILEPYHLQTTNLMRRLPFFSTSFNCQLPLIPFPQQSLRGNGLEK